MAAATAGPFRVMLRMQVKPGLEQEFEQVWQAVGDSVTSHPANLGQWLSRSLDEEGVYYIVSDWVDEARFREFETSRRHVEHRERLHPYRSGGAMTTMSVVAHLTSGPGGPATHEEWEARR
ncbi:antibiotic biosynthesis monooxygenase [Streptomyces mashuensis]|uniref:Antibiotic biosynthesis monooxygenase n=1 Tax=Streptomyces mashuensis TaxID=33904 RepID=A0A919BA08_9ACTN|nr:antibiotic biosynthesis monooxygenase family protein [Streptomyces mashuensis]GHF69298.1 antibiotic biosynthesis monooxygenase [Streptomyces mashuensis]